VTAYDYQLKTNQFLELHEPLDICPMWSSDDGNACSPIGAKFVEIKSIWVGRNNGHDIILRGLPYARTRQLHGRLECKRNEVCQIIEVQDDDERPDEEQALVEIRPEQILKTRIFIKTNKLYPRESRPRFDPVYNTRQKIEECAPLTCRWKMRVEYRDAAKRKAGKSYGGSLIKLGEHDVEKRKDRVPDKELRETWRGPSGSKSGRPPMPYTFGDMFCGAGGVSRGAVMAGLKVCPHLGKVCLLYSLLLTLLIQVKIAVDHWPVACKTYRRNFPDTQLYEGEIMSFINDDSIGYRSTPIDILHLSPPCQYFSPLGYIWRGRNQNEANADALLSCFHLINKMRPRFFTLEETFRLTQPKHSQFFNALIHGFTCHGYSVQWLVHF
jgi:DNA (cytosine-5)-methyltransferase 1